MAYFLVHRAVAPLPKDGPYAVRVDSRIFHTVALYWKWSLLSQNWKNLGHSAWGGAAIVSIVSAVLAIFVIRQVMKSRYSVLFFVFWFPIALAPMLPLPGHYTDYYLTIPLIGLAMLGGYGLSEALGTTWTCRTVGLILLVAYLSVMIPINRIASRWWLDRTRPIRGLVLGVAAAHETNPDKTIVLEGITSALYDDAIAPAAFYPLGLDRVYLTPGSEDRIHPATDAGRLPEVILDPGTLRNAITHEQVVIYSDVGDHLRNVTGLWERSNSGRFSPTDQQPSQAPRRVEVGNSLFAYLLGPEWYDMESAGFRWMPRRATLRLGGPRSVSDRLLLEGYCPDRQLKAGPLHLSVSVDGIPLPGTEIGSTETRFRRLFVVAPSLAGRESVEVAISVDRVLHEPGGRELGLVFGTIAFVDSVYR